MSLGNGGKVYRFGWAGPIEYEATLGLDGPYNLWGHQASARDDGAGEQETFAKGSTAF